MDEAKEQVEANQDDDKDQQNSLFDLLEKRADHNREKLDDLPEGLGAQLKELMEYDFMPSRSSKYCWTC